MIRTGHLVTNELADEIDEEGTLTDGNENQAVWKTLVASGFEEGIKYIFTMSATMAKVASEADFIQCATT